MLRRVPFVSRRGVPLHLDMASADFLYLCGKLATEPLEMMLMSHLVNDGDTFVDVGAHRGLYIPHVLGALGTTGRYYAVEPSGANCAFLRDTFLPSPLPLSVIQCAMSDASGIAYLERDGDVEARIVAHSGSGTRVEVKTLDDLLLHAPRTPGSHVIKIDAEGHESRILRGARLLAAAGIRPIFMLEYLPSIHGQQREDINQALADTFGGDYTLWAISRTHGGLIPLRNGAQQRADGVYNALAVPRSHLERLQSLPVLD